MTSLLVIMTMEVDMAAERREEGNIGERLFGAPGRDRRNSLAVLIWTLVWGATYTATLQAVKAGLVHGLLTWAMVAVSLITGVMALRAFVRFVRKADEMIHRLYVDALAFGFAAGAVFFPGSEILAALGGPVYGSNELFAAMCLAFAGKLFWTVRRYK
jgi:hypothetical protein